jgi:hypothetical protein
MAHAIEATQVQAERRRAAERMRGMFAGVAADRTLVDELIAERRAEAQAEQPSPPAGPRGRGD